MTGPIGEPAAESRRVVTILFADVAGSTALGERLDPEAVRRIMARYFAIARTAVQRHGGTVEKFIGDAVMAVFGLAELHEDDALRAVRAAAELQAELSELDVELEEDLGVRLGVRIGVMTGEVVAGGPADRETLVTGDPVNVAARLQASAEPGRIVLGEPTFRLVRAATRASPLGALELKGRSEPIGAYELEGVDPIAGPSRHRPDVRLVGREAEIAALLEAFDRVATAGRPAAATVVGAAGVGKSRLVVELETRIGERGTLLRGRCPPYGDGITWWPITEMVHAAAGIARDDRRDVAARRIDELLAARDQGALVADRISTLIGLTDRTIAAAEAEWAIRRLLDELARDRPLVMIFDDVQWAEPGLLDVLERLIESGARPILLIAMARPELAERRPEWLERVAETVLRLEALGSSEASAFLDALLGPVDLPAALRTRILAAAEGNPLFVEQFVAMLDDEGRLRTDPASSAELSRLPVPPTIQALLAARLDRLDPTHRPFLLRGSVVGRSFWRRAVAALSPADERAALPGALAVLSERQLVGPEVSEFTDDEAYRFHHLLVRDQAYATLSKAERADLHEALAAWLEGRAGDRLAEFEEIVGHHYASAATYVRELGLGRARRLALEALAAGRFRSAGDRAFRRGDMAATMTLLQQAVSLAALDDPATVAVLPTLAKALIEIGDLDGASARLAEATASAAVLGDDRTVLRARALQLLVRMWRETDVDGRSLEAEADALRQVAEADGDAATLALAWTAVTEALWLQGRNRDAEGPARKVVTLARAAGDERTALEYLALIASGSYWAWPVSDTIAICETALADGGGSPIVGARALPTLGVARAAAGDAVRGRPLVAEGIRLCRELGLRFWEAEMAGQAADLEEFAGDLAAAQTSWEAGWAFFERLGDRAHAAYFAAGAARLAALRELDGDAERWLERARSSAPDARHGAGTTALVAEAMLLRRQGDLATAEERIREAMSMAAFGRTGQGAAEPELRLLLASVLRRRGAVAEADAELHAAAESATAWGTLPTHDRIEAALADPGWPHDPPSGSAGRPAEAPDDADPAS